MKKEDFKVGMIVKFGRDRFGPGSMPRGVIVKINPKKAKVKSLDPAGKWPAGCIWTCPYGGLVPFVGGDEVSNEMTMRSFENPNDLGVKAWSAAQKSKPDLPDSLPAEDEHIVRAIHELYLRLEDLDGADRIGPSGKIHLLFRALGREVSREEAENLLQKIP
jgi:hypothetical protein